MYKNQFYSEENVEYLTSILKKTTTEVKVIMDYYPLSDNFDESDDYWTRVRKLNRGLISFANPPPRPQQSFGLRTIVKDAAFLNTPEKKLVIDYNYDTYEAYKKNLVSKIPVPRGTPILKDLRNDFSQREESMNHDIYGNAVAPRKLPIY